MSKKQPQTSNPNHAQGYGLGNFAEEKNVYLKATIEKTK
jgi:hypothetical protein